jgi:hypothetical protein
MTSIVSKLTRFTVLLVTTLAFAMAGCSSSGGDSAPAAPPVVAAAPATWLVPDGSTLSATQMASLFDSNQLYFNVKSAANSSGEIRGGIAPSSAVFVTDAGDPFAPNPANNPVTFAALLDGTQARPRNVITNANGYGSVTLNPQTKQLTGVVVTSGIAGSAAHINDGLPGATGAIIVTLEGGPVVWTIPANTVLTDAQIARLNAGAYYLDVHSTLFPDGELRGQLNQQVRFVSLKGSNETPAVSTSATGIGYLAFNPTAKQLSGFVKVKGLSSTATSAVIRFGAAGTNGPGIVDLVDSGNGLWSIPVISNPVLSSAVIAAFNNDTLYVNVHTQTNTGGEIRGQIVKSSARVGTAILNGGNEIPAVSTQGIGTGLLAWNSVTELVSGSVKTDKVDGTAATINSGSVSTSGPALISLTTTSPVTVTPTSGVSFALDIQPIFNASCAISNCHVPGGIGPLSMLPGVSYDTIAFRLVPGDASASYFYKRITENDPPSFLQMPLNKPPLSIAEQNLFKTWINKGALNN